MKPPRNPDEQRRRVIAETNAWLAKLPPEKRRGLRQLIVIDNGEYKGILHIHDILKEVELYNGKEKP